MINIYCDESCHLENDNSNIMVLGAISCEYSDKVNLFNDIRQIKIKHNLNSRFEVKWTKVSESKVEFYKELIDYFFSCDKVYFRGIVACNKKNLDHNKFNDGDYDTWYYKMYFRLLDKLVCDYESYRIFIDIKDTHGGPRLKKLHTVLCNNIYDYKNEVIKGIYQINSKESELLQLADLFIGMIGYYNRGLYKLVGNKGKIDLIDYIQNKYNVRLGKTTNMSEKKYNLFIWTPGRVEK